MSREKLDMITFGRILLSSGDLDPVYLALNRVAALWEAGQRNRWLTAYCAFYDCGVASWMSQFRGQQFWQEMLRAALNEESAPHGGRWSRGSERRHFRGAQAVRAVREWASIYGEDPEYMFDRIASGAPSFQEVRELALQHRSVGTWLSFKVVDLVDACMGGNIVQKDVTPFLYETPRESLLAEWRRQMKLDERARPKDEQRTLLGMMDWLGQQLSDMTIPHKPGQSLDYFALETVACKHKSHMNGHYPLYNDIDEINHGLAPWLSHCEAARQFAAEMPPRPKQ